MLEATIEDIPETPGLPRTDQDAVELSSTPRATGERRRPESTNPPRLIVRFAIYLAIGLALAAGGILVFVRQSNTTQAESYARERAELIGGLAMPIRLDAGTLSRPIRGSRKQKLDAFFQAELLRGTILSAAVYKLDGRRIYSIGRGSKRRELRPRLLRTVSSGTTTVVHTTETGKRLAVYTSFKPTGSATGVLSLEQDYAPIAQAARRAFIPIAAVLQIVMLVVFLMFIPLLRRITHRLRSQMGTIQHQALHDALTGLPNRTLFRDRIEQARHAGRRADGAAGGDADRPRPLQGDQRHARPPRRRPCCCRRSRSGCASALARADTVARLGGDEFGVLLPRRASRRTTATAVAASCSRSCASRSVIDGLTLEVDASIGIACYPEHGTDVETLHPARRHRDVRGQGARPRPSRCSSRELDRYSPRRLALAGELRRRSTSGEIVALLPAQGRPAHAARSSASRRSRAGSTRGSGSSARASSCRSPSRPA